MLKLVVAMLLVPILTIVVVVVATVLISILISSFFEQNTNTYYDVTGISLFNVVRDAGRYGEYLTYRRLKHYEKKGAKFLFNCYIPKGNGETTEIDVLMIHTSGVYVFESKNYSGWIFGDEKSKTWVQSLSTGRGKKAKKNCFFNPVLQNEKHIECLKDYIRNDSILCHSIIVFSNRCQLMKINVSKERAYIVRRPELAMLVNCIDTNNSGVMTPEEVDAIYFQLYNFTQVSELEKQQHIDNINKKLSDKTNNIFSKQNHIPENGNHLKKSCPRCGSELVMRTAKKGANIGQRFWGCSNFPGCRYIETLATEERK